MVRHYIAYTLVALVCVLGIYAAWRFIVAYDVWYIRNNIRHHNAQLKAVAPHMVLRADSVEPSGFPFRRNVAIVQMSLSMIEGEETFMLRFPRLELSRVRGGYRVKLPDEVEALYAKAGEAPEVFMVRTRGLEEIVFLSPDKIFNEYRIRIASSIVFDVTYGEATDSIHFLVPTRVIQRSIPNSLERELWMAVSVLREAMVFKTKH